MRWSVKQEREAKFSEVLDEAHNELSRMMRRTQAEKNAAKRLRKKMRNQKQK